MMGWRPPRGDDETRLVGVDAAIRMLAAGANGIFAGTGCGRERAKRCGGLAGLAAADSGATHFVRWGAGESGPDERHVDAGAPPCDYGPGGGLTELAGATGAAAGGGGER